MQTVGSNNVYCNHRWGQTTGQGRQGSIIRAEAKVQDGRKTQGQVRQRSVIQRWSKGTGWQAGSETGSGQAGGYRVKTGRGQTFFYFFKEAGS